MTRTSESRPLQQQTARDLASIFFIKKRVFLMTFFGILFGALAVSLLSPNIYEANMQMVVKPFNAKPLVFDEDSSRMNVFNEVTEKTLNTVIYMLKAPEVLREVVLEHKLADPSDESSVLREIAILQGSITAEPLTLSSLIEVRMRGRDAEGIAEQLNTLAAAYIRHHIKINQATEGRLEFFSEQTEFFRRKYEEATANLVEAGRSMQIVDSAIQKDTGLTLVRDLELNKLQSANQISVLIARIDSFKKAMQRAQSTSNSPLSGLPSETIASYPALIEMEKSLAQLHINRQRAANDFQPDSKQVRDAEIQFSSMKAQIQRNMVQIIQDLETQVGSLQKMIIEADNRILELHRSALGLSGNSTLLEKLALEQKIARDNYLLYSAKKEEARINDAKDKAEFANVAVSKRPAVPQTAWFPKKGTIMIVAFIVGLMLAFAFTAVSYAMEQRLWTPTDIIAHSNLRVLGTFDAIGSNNSGPGRGNSSSASSSGTTS
jgi:uncharacterized protein involved in exopolysaccharide biosynthesis